MFDMIADLTGSFLDYKSQQRTNETNVGLSREQMGFQKEMSSTAYQRAVADMRDAGLNPMLAYSQGGASSPSGSAAHIEAPRIGGAVSSALGASQRSAEIEAIKSNTDKSKAEAEVTRASLPAAVAESSMRAAQAEVERRRLELVLEGMEHDTDAKRSNKDIRSDEAANSEEYYKGRALEAGARGQSAADEFEVGRNTKHERADAILAEAEYKRKSLKDRLAYTALSADLLGEEVPRAHAEAEAWKGFYGEKIRPYLSDVGAFTSGAASARRALGLRMPRY